MFYSFEKGCLLRWWSTALRSSSSSPPSSSSYLGSGPGKDMFFFFGRMRWFFFGSSSFPYHWCVLVFQLFCDEGVRIQIRPQGSVILCGIRSIFLPSSRVPRVFRHSLAVSVYWRDERMYSRRRTIGTHVPGIRVTGRTREREWERVGKRILFADVLERRLRKEPLLHSNEAHAWQSRNFLSPCCISFGLSKLYTQGSFLSFLLIFANPGLNQCG